MNSIIAVLWVAQAIAVPAKPVQDAGFQIGMADYPAEAIARRESGTVEVSLAISDSGSVSECAIARSSGSAALDSRTCELFSFRGRYHPAQDAKGRSVPSIMKQRVTWRLPADELASARLKGELLLEYNRAGMVEGCTLIRSSGDRATDAGICQVIARRDEAKPRLDARGKRIPYREIVPFFVRDSE